MLKEVLGFVWRSAPKMLRRWSVRLVEPRFMVTAGAVVEDARGRVLLLNHVFRKGSGWGIPGGFLASGEQPEEALRRELREETGMEIESAEIAFARTLKRPQQIEIIYRCRVRDPAPSGRTSNLEINHLAWFDPQSLPEVSDDQRRLIRRVLDKTGAQTSD
jgi:ADP-ribose pyrophosphatase YjhB (NUDIX family)